MIHQTEGMLLDQNERQLLEEGRQHELAGRSTEAMECYAAIIDLAGVEGDQQARAEALRCLSVLHHLRAEQDVAAELCRRSRAVAIEAGVADLAAEADNALAGFALERGELEVAAELCGAALEVAGENPALRAKIEQNLGLVANIRCEWDLALEHYNRSLEAYRSISDTAGCATAHHNLGMMHAKQKNWQEADRHYRRCHGMAEAVGNRHLSGLAALNRAEVRLAIDDTDGAKSGAEEALRIFNEIEARRDKAGAHRMLGVVFRQRSQMALAESHLRSALEIAATAQCPLIEAHAARELALLYQFQGRPETAMTFLMRARAIYHYLEAVADLAEIEKQIISCCAAAS